MLNLGLLLCTLISCTFPALPPALLCYLVVVTLAFTHHHTCQKTHTCWYPWVQVEFSVPVGKPAGSPTVTNVSVPFFQPLDLSIVPGTYSSSTLTYGTLTTAIKNFGDSFVAMATKHMTLCNDGMLTSTVDLMPRQSYVSVTAFNAGMPMSGITALDDVWR
ncbi:uncharacterized protein EDB91DRAFT_1083734 [Suillus paluster]|uniref:uncharacterized protein n=1 Tax=Suillus paluster TaxID=48578 RepID=UPI001B86CF1B|nr:uncharacterized protein EDB91DRAFT_1083734 [Suillus paluster]KAG1735278.1 hypothetical protein EDB91DRAFT_1083734 [Suillus paluster]